MFRFISNFTPTGINRLCGDKSLVQNHFYPNGDEITWLGKDLIWSKHQCILQHFTMPGNIVKAVICDIDGKKCLAILFESGLTLYSYTGQSFLIPLPFQIETIYPLHKSLLLVRTQTSTFLHPQYSDFPILFTLSHPLEDIRPIALNTNSFNSPRPRYTTISSPSPRRYNIDVMTTPTKQDSVCFIVDQLFRPLYVSNERRYIFACTDKYISVWKLQESTKSRDILYSSPKFIKSPSIFSPPKNTHQFGSPGELARADIKATLEGIPPDLLMESIYNFEIESEFRNMSFCEISEGDKKILLFANDNHLDAIHINYQESCSYEKWFNDISSVCKYKNLMYFVVYNNGNICLHEENRLISIFENFNAVSILQYSNKFVISHRNNDKELFHFSLSSDKTILRILDVAHSTLTSENYSKLILKLSSHNSLKDSKLFVENFLKDLETSASMQISEFFTAMHFLYEDLKIQLNKYDERKFIIDILIKLAKKLNYTQYLLYYALYSDVKIEYDCRNSSDTFQADVFDLLSWCCNCISGRQLLPPPQTMFQLSNKVVEVFNAIQNIADANSVVVTTERAKLTLKEVKMLQPALSLPLLRTFDITAESPPEKWPIAAYNLIGRDDIAKILMYVENPIDKNPLQQFELPDLRFLEVERLLQSHLPVTVDIERPNGTDDIAFQKMIVQKLSTLLYKQWAQSFGRALFNASTYLPLPIENLVEIPLNLKGYTTNEQEIILSDDSKTEQTTINISFNNGVSVGLSVDDAPSSWLLASISEMTSFNAGVILGLSMNGLLAKLTKIDIYKYLTSLDIREMNAISVLLGIGISFRGTKDLGISHMLTMHVPDLKEFAQQEYDMSNYITLSAILGLGYLFEGSGTRHMSEAFLSLFDRSCIFEMPSISFAVGVSVGLINLGLGDSSAVMKELREKLCIIFTGIKTPDIYNEKIISFGNSDFYSVSPAAIYTLTIAYIRTDNKRVKSALTLPNNAKYINKMVHDVILLRTCAALLIDSDPKTAINFTIPDGLTPDVLACVSTGFALACGIKYAGTMDKKAYERLMMISNCLAKHDKTPFDFSECSVLHREICLANVILACSLIVAGTCDVSFLRYIRMLRRRPALTNISPTFGIHMAYSMAIGILNLGRGRYTLSQSNSASASTFIALYPRLPRAPSDNDLSPQFIRYLINTAKVPRVLEVRDVDTDEIVNLYVTLKLIDGSSFVIHTPHVLPPFNMISNIYVDDNRYYKIHFATLPFKDEKVRPIMWVKKKKNAVQPKICSMENFRSLFKMAGNEVFNTTTSQEIGEFVKRLMFDDFNKENDIKMTKNKLLWDENACDILNFFRSGYKERFGILYEKKFICDFLKFYGIPPWADIISLSIAEDEALATLMPFFTKEELRSLT